MAIPDEIRKCVVFLGYKKPTGEYGLSGTAFLVCRELIGPHHFVYLVTAKHVIQGLKDRDINEVGIRINLKGDKARWFDLDISLWAYHPQDSPTSYIDVAVAKIVGEMDTLDVMCYPLDQFATRAEITSEEIGAGDEVFLAGLFVNHHGKERNIPIVRVGNIAAMPEPNELVKTRVGEIEAYLIEARSIGGLSGSPVFVNLGTSRWKDGQVQLANRRYNFYLLGLMHGHWDVPLLDVDQVSEDSVSPRKVNMGIGIVVPAEKILETIASPMIRKHDEEAVRKLQQHYFPPAGEENGGT